MVASKIPSIADYCIAGGQKWPLSLVLSLLLSSVLSLSFSALLLGGVSCAEDDDDDPPPAEQGAVDSCSDDEDTRCNLAPDGQAINGSFESEDDTDWYRLTLAVGNSYSFLIQAAAQNGPTGVIAHLLPEGSDISEASDTSGGASASFIYTVSDASVATYYLAISPAGGSGAYSITVTDLGTDCANDDSSSCSISTPSQSGGPLSVAGYFHATGEDDWYGITLAAGKTYSIAISPASEGPTDIDGYLFDSSLASVESDTSVSESARLFYTVPTDAGGSYWISAVAAGGSGAYSITVADLGTDCADNDTTGCILSTPDQSGSSLSVDGYFDTEDDDDWYRITLSQDKTYRIAISAASGGPANIDGHLYRSISGSSGNPTSVASDTRSIAAGGAGVSFFYTIPAAAGGSYWISALATEGSGAYSITITDHKDCSADSNSLCRLTAPPEGASSSSEGYFHVSSDEDWYSVALSQNKTYRITISAASGGPANIDGHLYRSISGSSGAPNSVVSDTETAAAGGAGASLLYTVPVAEGGDYWISAVAAEGNGAYSITVADLTDCPANNASSCSLADPIEGAPAAVDGDFHAEGDEDWYSITLTGGKVYQIDITPAIGGPTDIDGHLYDSSSSSVASDTKTAAEGGASASLLYIAPSPGARLVRYISAVATGGNGQYSIGVADLGLECSDDVSSSCLANTPPPQKGASISREGYFHASSDTDWYRVALISNRAYQIEIEPLADDDSLTLEGALYNNSSSIVAADTAASDSSRVNLLYTARSSSEANFIGITAASGEGAYRITITDQGLEDL